MRPEETIMANPFVHVELMTGDVDKAKAFYEALFDWNDVGRRAPPLRRRLI